MRFELATEAQVRAAMTQLLELAARGIARASATALAAQLGISRPALYRHYRPLVDELLASPPLRPPSARTPGLVVIWRTSWRGSAGSMKISAVT